MFESTGQRIKFKRFFRSPPPIDGPVELTLQRVFILPTGRGMAFASIILGLLLTAFIYNNNLLYLLAFFLLSLFLVSMLHAYKSLAGLRVQVGFAQPVFAGDAARVPLIVNNPSGHPRLALRAALDDVLEIDVPAHQQKTVTLSATARKRGRQTIGTVTLDSRYPLGILRAWSPLCCDIPLLVYPKPDADRTPLPYRGQALAGQQSSQATRYDDFAGIRAYQAGDSMRTIHWKAYAKGQGLLTKQFSVEAGGNETWLDFDRTGAGHTEARLGQLCRWVLDAEEAGLRYGLLLPGRKIAPDSGAKHQANCLAALALYEAA
ncbi:MAG: DUF58 domain-containing protein [Gammaproteobacteria bacterium]